MEKYINEETIIKNEIYESFKDNIMCPICSCLMIEPVMCLNCQNSFCKKCIEDWKKKGGICPNKCQNSIIKDVIGKNNFITKFKFKCIRGCGAEIKFDDIKNHYSSDCLSVKKKITPLSAKETAEYKKKTGNDVPHLSSKSFNLYIIYSNNFGH